MVWPLTVDFMGNELLYYAQLPMFLYIESSQMERLINKRETTAKVKSDLTLIW